MRALLAERAPGLSETEARALAACLGWPPRSRRAPARSRGAWPPRRVAARRAFPYADPELDPADAAATLIDASRVVGAAARERAEAGLAGIELTARESEQRLRRVQRGAEREELLAMLEELASWYRDLVVVAVGAEQAAVHADRLDVLREDATRDRARGRRDRGRAGARCVARRSRSSTSIRPSTLEALFVQLSRASFQRFTRLKP